MESNSKQSNLSGRVGAIDVSQLDKVNAIPNKTTDNILMDGLCQEDRFYLNALIEDDCSDNEDENRPGYSSAWSPMAQSPVMASKRIKKLRPSYAVTLSLEDISYIRPSWGISKGIRTIEINKKKPIKADRQKKEPTKEKTNHTDDAYQYLLVFLTVIVLCLTLPVYIFERQKDQGLMNKHRMQLSREDSMAIIFKPEGESLEPLLKIRLGELIPKDLKPDICNCDLFVNELNRFVTSSSQTTEALESDSDRKHLCVGCFDWAVRANLRIYLDKEDQGNSLCYYFKWQSYDPLLSPLMDCFIADDGRWIGLGDIHPVGWTLDEDAFDSTPLNTNLTAEFLAPDIVTSDISNQTNFGSFVNMSMFSTVGISIDDLKTDFEPALKFRGRSEDSDKMFCLSASCTDKCTQSWLRPDHLNKFRLRNNILEYKVCSANSIRTLISSKLSKKVKLLKEETRSYLPLSENIQIISPSVSTNRSSLTNETSNAISSISIERESGESISKDQMNNITEQSTTSAPLVMKSEVGIGSQELPSGIGLIDRTIFATSPEFMPVLDGQILRQYVHNIVKLDLKSSSILLIDTRWETYVGSLTLDGVAFPRPKVLFEILHNKGFKIVFTIKPYIDTIIGMKNLNQLFEAGRLYKASRVPRDAHFRVQTSRTKGIVSSRDSIIRRRSLFQFENVTVEIGSIDSSRFPYLYKCKEAREGFCVLLDLTQERNRAWMAANIKRSSLLSLDADGILIGGSHPIRVDWDDHYRSGMSALVKDLFYKERLFILPQWTANFGYIQLTPRSFDWLSLRSIVSSVINLNSIGFSLVHPGSVWGDLKTANLSQGEDEMKSATRINNIYGNIQPGERSQEELAIRWLQVAVFLPILQFNNIAPIQRFGLHELLQNLVRIRRLTVVPEMKKNLPYCPLVNQGRSNASITPQLPLIRPVWFAKEHFETIVPDQFSIGSEIIVAPILTEGQRQRDIFLPSGYWRDELHQTSVRGGKWLRNYGVELNVIPWFVREKR